MTRPIEPEKFLLYERVKNFFVLSIPFWAPVLYFSISLNISEYVDTKQKLYDRKSRVQIEKDYSKESGLEKFIINLTKPGRELTYYLHEK